MKIDRQLFLETIGSLLLITLLAGCAVGKTEVIPFQAERNNEVISVNYKVTEYYTYRVSVVFPMPKYGIPNRQRTVDAVFISALTYWGP